MRATFFATGEELSQEVQTHGLDQDPTFEWGGKVWAVQTIRTQRGGAKLDAVVVDK